LDFYFSDNFGFGHHSEYHSYMYMHIRTWLDESLFSKPLWSFLGTNYPRGHIILRGKVSRDEFSVDEFSLVANYLGMNYPRSGRIIRGRIILKLNQAFYHHILQHRILTFSEFPAIYFDKRCPPEEGARSRISQPSNIFYRRMVWPAGGGWMAAWTRVRKCISNLLTLYLSSSKSNICVLRKCCPYFIVIREIFATLIVSEFVYV
jgi:hypothetical protein